MNDKEYTSLYNRYKMSTEEELRAITVENGYTEIAERVASDILHSDRAEYNQKLEERDKMEEQRHLKEVAQQNNPLYDDIHQIAQDLHFIKNLIIIILILSVIAGIITGLSII